MDLVEGFVVCGQVSHYKWETTCLNACFAKSFTDFLSVIQLKEVFPISVYSSYHNINVKIKDPSLQPDIIFTQKIVLENFLKTQSHPLYEKIILLLRNSLYLFRIFRQSSPPLHYLSKQDHHYSSFSFYLFSPVAGWIWLTLTKRFI